jgi:hypothetical protein
MDVPLWHLWLMGSAYSSTGVLFGRKPNAQMPLLYQISFRHNIRNGQNPAQGSQHHKECRYISDMFHGTGIDTVLLCTGISPGLLRRRVPV